MALISVHNLTCKQPVKTLFKDATFAIEPTDKVAIIGLNGSGKTTLLKKLADSLTDPDKQIITKKGLTTTYLTQDIKINPEHTILDHLFQSKTPASKAIHNYQKCLASDPTETDLIHATEQVDHLNAWQYEAHVSSILKELNITNLNQKMKDISGGMRKKIALAETFFEQTDLLILDEPTNHLDIKTIEWLETTLKRQRSALLMVTHDRYFLNKVCTKIIEIDQEQIFTYNGNYQLYLEQRALRYQSQVKKEQTFQSILKGELAWLKQGPKARSTKQRARKDRIDILVNQEKQTQTEAIKLEVAGKRLGKKILDVKHLTKTYGDKTVCNNFTYTFKQGERIGILGPNGVGKTTFLNLITEKISADSGEVDKGINTQFGYFDQHSQDFDLSQTIYEHISDIGSQIQYADGTTLSAAKFLERFLFTPKHVQNPHRKIIRRRKRDACISYVCYYKIQTSYY